MDKWFKDILPDKDPYHNCGRDQMRKKGGPEIECLWYVMVYKRYDFYYDKYLSNRMLAYTLTYKYYMLFTCNI